MKKLLFAYLLFLAIAPVPLAPAQDLKWIYSGGYQVTGTSAKTTLQIASGSTRAAIPIRLNVTCPDAACTITIIRNGSVATATSGTIYKSFTAEPASGATFYTASNSSGGTSLPVISIAAGGPASIDLREMGLEIVAGENVSFSIATTMSQQITVSQAWEEFNP